MIYSTSRILIETIVKKAFQNMQESPERNLRNLVDMALNFSEGRFQQHFFEVTQTMLQNEKSHYYGLIQDVTTHVDTERLLTLGMNVGYNSCTAGAQKIRELERSANCNIPWTIFLQINESLLQKRFTDYDRLISEGETLGIYSWMIFAEEPCTNLFPLAKKHPDSSFFLFCNTRNYILPFLDSISEIKNMMFVIRGGKDQKLICNILRSLEIPYSVYDFYTDENLPSILNGQYLTDAQNLHPIFACLIPSPECSYQAQNAVRHYISSTRNNQDFQLIASELTDDCITIDHIISDDTCFAFFDKNGQLYTLSNNQKTISCNLFQSSLFDIFKFAFPKSNSPI